MLHILGMILKGIGITLLCILLLLLFFLLVILFVPVRYRIAAGKPEEGGAEARAKASWLFSIVTVFAVWEGTLHYGVKIFGVSVYDNLKKAVSKKEKAPKKEKKKKQKKAKKEKKNQPAQKEEKKEQKTPKTPERPAQSEIRAVSRAAEESEAANTKTEAVEAVKKENTEKETVEREEKAEKESEAAKKKSIWQKLEKLVGKCKALFRKLIGILQKIARIPEKLNEKTEELKEKAKELKEKWEIYRAFLEREDFQRSVSLCRKQLIYVWRKVRPKKCKVQIRFGFDDPSVTGQILAYAGMLYPLLGKDMKIRPDFERKVLEGSVLIKGRITVFTFIKVFCVLYFNRDIKRMLHIWKTKNVSE